MPATISISNRLLVGLAAENLDPLRPHFQPVSLPHNQTLSKPGTPIEHVYFVQQGMVSLVQPLENGAMIEVGMIGNEGFVGVPVLLGAESSPLEAMVQIPWLSLTDASERIPRRTHPSLNTFGAAAAVYAGTPCSGLVIGGLQRAAHLA